MKGIPPPGPRRRGALRIVRFGEALDVAAKTVVGDPEPGAQKGPRPAVRSNLPSREILEPGEEELPGLQACLRRLTLARGPVVRVAPPVEGARPAEFQLRAQPVWQADARRQMKLQTVVEGSGVEELPASVERGMAGVCAIDEPGVPRAGEGRANAQVGGVQEGVRPCRGESSPGSVGVFGSSGGAHIDRQGPHHHDKRQERCQKSCAAGPMHVRLAFLVCRGVCNSVWATQERSTT